MSGPFHISVPTIPMGHHHQHTLALCTEKPFLGNKIQNIKVQTIRRDSTVGASRIVHHYTLYLLEGQLQQHMQPIHDSDHVMLLSFCFFASQPTRIVIAGIASGIAVWTVNNFGFREKCLIYVYIVKRKTVVW